MGDAAQCRQDFPESDESTRTGNITQMKGATMSTKFAALFMILAVASTAPAQTTLRYKYAKGDSNTYELTQNMKMAQNVGGNNIGTTMKQTMVMTTTVQEILPNGNAKVETKFDHVRMEMDMPGLGNVVLDSKDENPGAGNPIGAVMGGMIKTLAKVQFVATMTPLGETVDFKMPKELIDEFKAMPGGAQMGDMFSEQGIKNMMGASGLVLPKNPINKGEGWNQKVSTKMPMGKMDADMKYTFQGSDTSAGKSLEKFGFVPNVKIAADENAAVNIQLDSQKGEGTVLFDNAAGRVVEFNLNQVMEMTITVQNMNITSTIDQKTSMKLKTK